MALMALMSYEGVDADCNSCVAWKVLSPSFCVTNGIGLGLGALRDECLRVDDFSVDIELVDVARSRPGHAGLTLRLCGTESRLL